MSSVLDDFNRVDASTLGAGWANAGGADFSIVSQRAKTASGSWSVAKNLTDLESADHKSIAQFVSISSGAWLGVAGRLNASNNNGYIFIVHNTGRLQIRRWTAGALGTQVGTEVTVALPSLPFTAEFRVEGSSLKGFINDSEVIAESDSTYPTGSLSGIVTSGAANLVDNFEARELTANEIILATPSAYQVFQRDNLDVADIEVAGTYTGTPTSIEYQFDGGGWLTLDASPSGGTYSGTISDVAAGSQGIVEVRFGNDNSVIDSVDFVGVGDVFVVYGQSNAEGKFNSAQTYSHASLKAGMYNSGGWSELADPTHEGTANGSVWPLLATTHMADQGVPIAFVCAAKGGQDIEYFKSGGIGYSALSSYLMNSNINAVRAVLFHQGEADASAGTTKSSYNTSLDALAASLDNDFSFIDGAKVIVAQIGQRTSATDSHVDAIRKAQAEAWDDNSTISPGPVLYDEILGDGVHFADGTEAGILNNRWWASVDEVCFDGDSGRGPQLESVSQDGNILTLTFDKPIVDPEQNYSSSAFLVTDEDIEVTINSAIRASSTTVDLNLASEPIGIVLVSFALGSGAAGLIVPRGVDANSLPAEPFYSFSFDGSGGGQEPPTSTTTKGAVVEMIEPISSEGIVTLVQGDDYLDVDGRALLWTGKNENQWPDLTGASIVLTAGKDSETFTMQGVVVSAVGTQSVRVELTAAETEVNSGWWDYDVQATLSNSDVVTMVIGRLRVIQDYS